MAEQLDAYRVQQAAAQKVDNAIVQDHALKTDSADTWATKKRRRKEADHVIVKSRKLSASEKAPGLPDASPAGRSVADLDQSPHAKKYADPEASIATSAASALGLAAYSSDED
jgi:hypothetical protein